MRLGKHTNGRTDEMYMQHLFPAWVAGLKKEFNNGRGVFHDYKCFPEVSVPEVHRRADFLLLGHGKLINVEAKSNAFGTLMNQMKDHAKYCDYSFAFIPDYSLTPSWFKGMLAKSGFGLIIYNLKTECITEVLEAHCNRPPDKVLRKSIIEKLNNRDNGTKKV